MLTSLQRLEFIETNFQATDLVYLSGLKKLNYLNICECEGGDVEIARFKQFVPDCYVQDGPCSKD